MAFRSGRHFLQIPGPTNVPDRVLRAIDMPTMDHRGPEFSTLGKTVLSGLQAIFQTAGPVLIYPASGTGAWEAAIVNTLSPGDHVQEQPHQDQHDHPGSPRTRRHQQHRAEDQGADGHRRAALPQRRAAPAAANFPVQAAGLH